MRLVSTCSNALGNVHNEVRQELRDSDLRQIASTLTRDLIYPLWMLNGRAAGDPRRHPRFVFDTSEPDDMAAYSTNLPNLVKLGMRIPQAWAHEKLMIPQPEGNEPVLTLQPALDNPSVDESNDDNGATSDKKAAKLAALSNKDDADSVYMSDFEPRINKAGSEVLEIWMQTIEAEVSKAESWEALETRLAELAATLDINDMTAMLEQAFTAAALAGRYELITDAK